MQVENVLSGVLSGGSSIPLHQIAARLRPVEAARSVDKLPESNCQNCGTCPNCQAKIAAEAASQAAFGIVDTVELSPAALTPTPIGADPNALKKGAQQPGQAATTYDAFGRSTSGTEVGEAQAPQPGNAKPANAEAAAQTEQQNSSAGTRSYDELTPEEQQQVDELKARDTEVRQHEQAHLAAAGPYALGGATYEYQTGPDGNKYAVGGEVQIDTSPIEGDPEATIRKMETVIAAALAPAEPSGQDRSVASQARAALAAARVELAEQQRAALNGEGAGSEGGAGIAASLNPLSSASPATPAESRGGSQLYNARGSSTPANDGHELARELDLVA